MSATDHSLPTISIITPSYNQGPYLEQTLRSVISQRQDVHEYFVLDGGSTDASPQIIRQYADQIDYWVSEKDKGQSDAIRKGFARATGDFLLWLNSDDVLLPGAVQAVRQALGAHPNWDVVTGYHAWIDADSRIIAMHRSPHESAAWARWGVVRVPQPACFFRRSLYEKVGGVRLDLHCVMDTELWYRMFDAGAVWGHVPRYICGFRKHEISKGSSWIREYAAEYEMMEKEHPRYAGRGMLRRAGNWAYRLKQILNGEYPRSRLETRSYRGKPLTSVFGEWRLPTPAAAAAPATHR